MIKIFQALIFAALSLFSTCALADYSAVMGKFYTNSAGYTLAKDSAAEACKYTDNSGKPYYENKSSSVTNSVLYGTVGSGDWGCLVTSGSSTAKWALNWSFTCPYGGTLSGATCKGADKPPCVDKNEYIRKFYYTSGGPYTAPNHYDVCQIIPQKMLVCRTDAQGTYCMWSFNRTGNLYQGADTPGTGAQPENTGSEVKTDPQTNSPPIRNPASKPDICPTCIPCPQGSVQAGIDSDGVPLCVGSGTNPVDPPKTPTTTTKPATSTTDSSGTVTTIQDSVQQNSDGSTTTTTTTTVTKSDGTKTVSVSAVTGNTPAGNQGKTDTPSSDQYNLCKQNPNLSICKNSTVSGTCGEITCSGDAIQCATLRAAAAIQCQQKKDVDDLTASPLTDLGKSASAGNDPLRDKFPSVANADVVSMPSIDQSGWMGNGAFFTNKTIALWEGQSVTIEFAKLEPYLIGLRYATMILASLACFRILRGAVNREG